MHFFYGKCLFRSWLTLDTTWYLQVQVLFTGILQHNSHQVVWELGHFSSRSIGVWVWVRGLHGAEGFLWAAFGSVGCLKHLDELGVTGKRPVGRCYLAKPFPDLRVGEGVGGPSAPLMHHKILLCRWNLCHPASLVWNSPNLKLHTFVWRCWVLAFLL